MASPPPHAASPAAMSPPYPSPASIPSSKKRTSSFDASNKPPALKRRKASTLSQSSVPLPLAHPLRQTSFPPPEARSPAPTRSPSVDATSHVSGSAVSGAAARKKRPGGGRKSRAARADDAASSVAGGKAATTASGQGGEKEDDDEDDDKAEMALEHVVARTQEQKQEEIRLRAMLVEAFDGEQYNRYELWRAAKLSDAVVKRVVNATVSQSVPQMVSTAVKAVAKLFAGELLEEARGVQAEWIRAGEHQSELPTPPPAAAAATDNGDEEPPAEQDPKRGPLRPDHLRAAWLRYRASKHSHGVGMQQLWHNQQGSGVERFSARTRKQLFK
ncbi:transcription initiation factor TFIID subunit [Cordyceps militaris]|uniref:Transcription initiation factor TFIID subunit n=1 Tax=Cordyceps militaris TaxID=73501 RepID=A0A2H4SED6_CORMI|nr:transcription initiation factor TFIID subunit [Cordyceps militaris]